MPNSSSHLSAVEYAQTVLHSGAYRCADGSVVYRDTNRQRGAGKASRGMGSLIPCYIPRDLDDLATARNRDGDDPIEAQKTRATLTGIREMKGGVYELSGTEQDRLKLAQGDKRHEGVNERRLLRGKPTLEQEEKARDDRRALANAKKGRQVAV